MAVKLNVHQRLAQAMQVVSYIQKDSKPGMKYTIVSHDAVTAKVRPALLEAGIVYYPVRCEHVHNGNRAECSMAVRFVNIDDPADFFEVPTFGYGIDPQDKGPGKAMSYAVKYALLKAMGLETGDDPDQDHDVPDHTSFDPQGFRDRVKREIENARTLPDLQERFAQVQIAKRDDLLPEPILAELTKAKNDRKAALSQHDAAMQGPPDDSMAHDPQEHVYG